MKSHALRSTLISIALEDGADRDKFKRITTPRVRSGARSTATIERTTGPVYIFNLALDDNLLYVKIVLRADCIVVSFHEDLLEP